MYVKYRQYRLYWSFSSAIRMDIIADAMPLKEFKKMRFLNFIDKLTIPTQNNSCFIEVRPILDTLNQETSNTASLTEFQAIDEIIIKDRILQR